MPAPDHAVPEAEAAQPAQATTYTDIGPGYLSGNITHDPDLRFTPQGQAVAKVRVAETPRVQHPETQEWVDGPTSFYDVVIWGEQGTRAVERLAKGDRIIAHGQWQRQKWTSAEGEQRSKLVLTARDIGPSLLFKGAIVERGQRKAGKPE